MELLVVGAGAVGSVYGYLASRNPAPKTVKVTYLIKPKHRKGLEEGLKLYHWKGRRAEKILFKEFSLIESIKEVEKLNFDAVLITLPSDKIREEGWLESLLKATKTAKVWSLQPNPTDRDFIRQKMKAAGISDIDGNLVFGSIPILSYLAPMPGENFTEPGYAFYLPPTSKAAWSSKVTPEAKKTADLFSAGGLPSKVVAESDTNSILPEALLRCLVAGLEKSEWSFDRFLNGPNLLLVTEGIREMTAIFSKKAGVKDPGKKLSGKLLSTGFGIRAAVRGSRLLMPFDFEAFLRVHFTKVETQMHQAIEELIESAKESRLPATNLKLLRGRGKSSRSL